MPSQELVSVSDLVSTALARPERSAITHTLRRVAEQGNAYSCILWQALPGIGRKSRQPHGRLVLMAEYFQGQGGTWIHEMPFNSVTGKAILNQAPECVENIWDERSGVFTQDAFLKLAGIVSMCSIPVRFRASAGESSEEVIDGAVNLYRNKHEPFTQVEIAELQELASVLPTLYQTIWDGIASKLTAGVNDVLRLADGQTQRIALSKTNMTSVTRRICQLVTDTLGCVETSVFLEHRMKSPGYFELAATSWRGRLRKTVFEKGGEGLLGWAASNTRPVRIVDVASFERVREKGYDLEYKGISFVDTDTLDIPSIRQALDLRPYARLPRLSVMAAPIMEGSEIGGLIRCSIVREAPYYFSERELNLLVQVASQVSRYWTGWLDRRKSREEVHSWRIFAERFKELDAFVRKELRTDQDLSETRIFEQALKNAKPIIPGAEIMDVRSFNKDKNALCFSATHGRAWNEGDAADIQRRKRKEFKLDGTQKSLGARVFNNGVAELIEDVHRDDDYSETFPDTKRIIVAPIKVAEKVYGVMDIRGTEDRSFPDHALAVAELLGQQLGLYCLLVETVRQIRGKESELKKSLGRERELQDEQRQVLEDLNHQLYGPITEAHGRAHSILREGEELHEILDQLNDENLVFRFEDNLLALRGLCGKTKRVTMSTGLFADLEVQEPEEKKLERLQQKLKLKRIVHEPEDKRNPDDIVKKLIEAARDCQSLTDPESNIRFWVARDTFNVLESNVFLVDYDMLEQMIVNLLDNAFKYAHPNTVILIEGGLTRTQRFYITFSNTGIPIDKKDTDLCKGRAWRGEKAGQATGEGSGIGLWIVDNIMRAHKGQLEVTCDVQDENTGFTKIRLLFSELQVEGIPNSDLYRLAE